MSCAKAVVTAYKKCAGVTDATVDFAKSTATVTYDPTKVKEETLVTEALKGTRFAASKIDDKDKKPN